ncbi:MAG: ribonuclease P protein subunit [Candidatus Lokiarchaeota archaeon]|nr:ribonuclease P protein subunit [Candidatus Lokiarchaeota archaeon]
MHNISQDPMYFIYRDMIGLEAWIKHKFNTKPQEFIPIGKVIDETYNLIITSKMENPAHYHQDEKKYVKKNYIFRFKVPKYANGHIIMEVDGEKLLKRPENRIKQIRKIRYVKTNE